MINYKLVILGHIISIIGGIMLIVTEIIFTLPIEMRENMRFPVAYSLLISTILLLAGYIGVLNFWGRHISLMLIILVANCIGLYYAFSSIIDAVAIYFHFRDERAYISWYHSGLIVIGWGAVNFAISAIMTWNFLHSSDRPARL